ncbi:MAG TPA: alpha/beta hydrolase [Bryobacteraceae bacterium]
MSVVLFVHGGGFVAGDKGGADAPWPAGSEDIGAAVRFLRASVERWGGAPNGIILMGQSAGAVHVARYLAMARLHAVPNGGIAGAIMVSGLYDIVRADRNPFQAAYYGADASRWPEQSTLGRLVETSVPCFYRVSEFDPPDFQRQAAWLVEAHAAHQGRWPRLLQLTGHNHLSSVLQIGTALDTLGPELLRLIHTVRERVRAT